MISLYRGQPIIEVTLVSGGPTRRDGDPGGDGEIDHLLPGVSADGFYGALPAWSFCRAGGLTGDDPAGMRELVNGAVSPDEIPGPLPFVFDQPSRDIRSARQVKAVLVDRSMNSRSRVSASSAAGCSFFSHAAASCQLPGLQSRSHG
jgi:hypothetical protein